MKYFCSSLIIFLFSFSIYGQDVPRKTYKHIVAEFFENIENGKVEEAIDDIYSYCPWSESFRDDIEQVKSQLKGLIKLAGTYNGNEFLYDENLRNRFVIVNYMLLYDRQPIIVKFSFYKPKDDWITYSFSYSSDLDETITEKAKLKFYYEELPY